MSWTTHNGIDTPTILKELMNGNTITILGVSYSLVNHQLMRHGSIDEVLDITFSHFLELCNSMLPSERAEILQRRFTSIFVSCNTSIPTHPS